MKEQVKQQSEEIKYTLISLKLPDELIKKMDEKAEKTYKNRTEYIKDLIVDDLKQAALPL